MRLALAGKMRPRGPYSILIACSDRALLRLCQVNLEREGHAVTAIADPAETIKVALKEVFDIYIVDSSLESIGWRGLIGLLHESERHQESAFLGIAQGYDEEFQEFYDLGFHLVLTHPLNPRELIGLLK